MSVQIFLSNTKFTNQARLGQIMFKPIKLPEDHQVRWPVWGLNVGLVETLSLVLRTQVFTSVLIFTMMSIMSIFLYCHGQGNWLVCSIILVGPFSYWVTLLHCWMWEQTAIASLRYFLGKPQGSSKWLNNWLCHLINELRECVGIIETVFMWLGWFWVMYMVFHPKISQMSMVFSFLLLK